MVTDKAFAVLQAERDALYRELHAAQTKFADLSPVLRSDKERSSFTENALMRADIEAARYALSYQYGDCISDETRISEALAALAKWK